MEHGVIDEEDTIIGYVYSKEFDDVAPVINVYQTPSDLVRARTGPIEYDIYEVEIKKRAVYSTLGFGEEGEDD